MAYLMSDMAAGSDAALKMQQNMAAAPYVQETAALAAEQNQLEIQQKQANLEKTRLNTMVEESGFKAKEESKARIQKVVTSPEFQAADEVKRLQLLSAVQFESGDIEGGAKTAQASEIFDAKKVANEQKQLDKNAQVVGNAYAAIHGADEKDFPALLEKMPKQQRDAIESQIPGFFQEANPKLQKSQLEALMMNAKGQLAQRKWEADAARQKATDESRERSRALTDSMRLLVKMTGGSVGRGGSKDELAALKVFQVQHQKDQVAYKSERKALDTEVDNAQKEVDKGRLFGLFGASEDTVGKLDRAIQARKDFELDQVERDFETANLLPTGPAKDRIIQELKRRTAMLGKGETPDAKEDTPVAEEPKKPSAVPSNKGNAQLKSAVEAAGQKYEPTKYDYRIAPDGSIQRKAK